jgi:hypothetical protein
MPSVPTTALLSLLLLAAPVAHAAYAFGTMVDKNDYDFQPVPTVRPTVPTAGKWVLPCFADADGNGIVNDLEPVYLVVLNGLAATCTTNSVKEKSFRLSPAGPYAAGSEVKLADQDGARALTVLAAGAHALRVANMDNLATVRKADSVYLDLNNPGAAAPQVDIGDLRLTPYGTLKAGTRVAAGDADLNFHLSDFASAGAKTFYTSNMVYEFGKGWYLNADLDAAAGGAVEEGDVRLTATVPNPFADVTANIGNPGNVVDGLNVSDDVLAPGQSFQAFVTVKNPTAKIGSALVRTSIDGVVVDARGTPSLVQNEVQTLVLTLTAPTEVGRHKLMAGDYTFFIDVDGPAATQSMSLDSAGASTSALEARIAALEGQLAAAQSGDSASAQASANGIPALAPSLVLVALASALLVLRRRA